MNDGPIENYLDNLFVELRRNDPRSARSMLHEAEAHLRDAADEAVRAGMSPEDAEAEAVRRFGKARLVAAADRAHGRLWVARGIVHIRLVIGSLGSRRRGGERPGGWLYATGRGHKPVPGRALA